MIAAERRDVYSYAITLIISEVRRRCTFYRHYVPTARFCPSIAMALLQKSIFRVREAD